MHLAPIVSSLFVLLSLSSTSTATDNVIRVPLQRKSFTGSGHSTLSPDRDSRDLSTRSSNVAGYVNSLELHLTRVAGSSLDNVAAGGCSLKYRTTLAAYQSNTGAPHPLALAISATAAETSEADQSDSGGMAHLVGRLEKQRRKRDIASDPLGTAVGSSTSRSHVPRGRHVRRDDISLTEVNSNMWMGTISVGNPPKDFIVDFDTGSSDLILPAQACDSTCDGHTRYDPTASSTSVDLDTTFQLVYGGGSSVNGTEYTDNVYMGGYEAVNQTLGAATTYSSGLESSVFPPDGLLGMGFSEISVFHASPVFQTLVSDGVVPQGVFGFALSPESGKSELTIGGTNTSLYQESTTEYVNVSLPAYWQVRFAGLFRPDLNGTGNVVVVNETSYAEAIIDTGTTLIITSDSNAQAFYANVTGAEPSAEVGGGVWTVPCDTIGLLAPTLTFGSRSFAVSPSTFNLGPVSDGSTDCIAGLAGGGSPYWIIGDVFLQNVYTIFDVTNTRIGFADLA